MAFKLKGKNEVTAFGAGILACPIAEQSKKALIAFRIEGNRNLFNSRYAILRYATFATRSGRQRCLRRKSFSCLFPKSFSSATNPLVATKLLFCF
jgi:hypothetical protein